MQAAGLWQRADEAATNEGAMSQHARRVYLAPDQFENPPPPFRTGAAGFIQLGPEDEIELQTRVRISANSTHALIGHGVVDTLNDLSLEGRLGSGVPVPIRPNQLEPARRILYQADRKTYGGHWEFVIDRKQGPTPTEYCVAIENREYQITLSRLIDVLNEASRVGYGVWIEI